MLRHAFDVLSSSSLTPHTSQSSTRFHIPAAACCGDHTSRTPVLSPQPHTRSQHPIQAQHRTTARRHRD
eukprot:2777145-Rhodomonas_salina.2